MLRSASTVLLGASVIVACSRDEFSVAVDASTDVSSQNDASSQLDAASDADVSAVAKCAGYAGPGFCDDFDVARDGAADLDPRWVVGTAGGTIGRSSSASRSAPFGLRSVLSNAGNRAIVTHFPKVVTVRHVTQKFSVSIGAECAVAPGVSLAGVGGIQTLTQAKLSAALVLAVSTSAKIGLVVAIAADAGPVVVGFAATKDVPLGAFVDLTLDLVLTGGMLHATVVQDGVLVIDETLNAGLLPQIPTFYIGLDTQTAHSACAAAFDDVILEATP
ncbi:hypothetical protein BH09MYX1_BH09MYX1_20610 [soil metagenome]